MMTFDRPLVAAFVLSWLCAVPSVAGCIMHPTGAEVCEGGTVKVKWSGGVSGGCRYSNRPAEATVLELYDNGKAKVEILLDVREFRVKCLAWRIVHPKGLFSEIAFRKVDEYVPAVKCISGICEGDRVCSSGTSGKVRRAFADGYLHVEGSDSTFWTYIDNVSKRST